MLYKLRKNIWFFYDFFFTIGNRESNSIENKYFPWFSYAIKLQSNWMKWLSHWCYTNQYTFFQRYLSLRDSQFIQFHRVRWFHLTYFCTFMKNGCNQNTQFWTFYERVSNLSISFVWALRFHFTVCKKAPHLLNNKRVLSSDVKYNLFASDC